MQLLNSVALNVPWNAYWIFPPSSMAPVPIYAKRLPLGCRAIDSPSAARPTKISRLITLAVRFRGRGKKFQPRVGLWASDEKINETGERLRFA